MKFNKKTKKMSLVLGLISFFLYLQTQNNWIQTVPIKIKHKKLNVNLEGLKIVHISDVHLPRNGVRVKNLLHQVEKQQPHLIVMTGDLIDRTASFPIKELQELCTGLNQLAPTYAVTGNHEHSSDHLEEWKAILRQNAVKVLDNTYEIFSHNGGKIALMGMEDGRKYPAGYFVNEAIRRSNYKILLTHRPTIWKSYYPAIGARPDLVFSGHAHGGQVRIPFIGGLLAPDQGPFPKYTSGRYRLKQGGNLIVSRGLGNSKMPIRIHNRPHLPVITLFGKDKKG